jgi:hypothetical protein
MLSTGLAKMLLPPVALVTEPRAPVRRSPRTMSTVKVSLTFRRRRVGRADLARLRQRDRDVGAADLERRPAQRVVEAELEGDVFLAVAVVVDVDLVERVRVELEIVRAAVGVLQRQVVGDQGDVAGAGQAGRLVAVEHVEVGAVDLGVVVIEALRGGSTLRRGGRQAGQAATAATTGSSRAGFRAGLSSSLAPRCWDHFDNGPDGPGACDEPRPATHDPALIRTPFAADAEFRDVFA